MNRILNLIRAAMTGRRLALVAAPVAMVSLAAPAMSAEPWWSGWGRSDRHERGHDRDHDRDRDRPVVVMRTGPVVYPPVVIGHPVVVAAPPIVVVKPVLHEVVPNELSFAAYQSGDTVIVTVNGSNVSRGFTTSLAAGDLCAASPVLVLHNTIPAGEAACAAVAPFTVNASIHESRRLGTVTVRVAGRDYCVPVAVAPCLS